MRRYLKFLGRQNTNGITVLADSQAALVIENGTATGIVVGDGEGSPLRDLPVATLGAAFLDMPSSVTTLITTFTDFGEFTPADILSWPSPGTVTMTFAVIGFDEIDGIYRGTTKTHHVDAPENWGVPMKVATLERYSAILAPSRLADSPLDGMVDGIYLTMKNTNGEWTTPIDLVSS